MGIRSERGHNRRRKDMVDRQIRRRGISDEAVLHAMSLVPRHAFVPESQTGAAYADCALPIGFGATISQPYVVAMMTEALELEPGIRVLEVGTGSGYQAAVLAACGGTVFSVERIPELHERARHALDETGFAGISLRLGDGSRGWPEEAPFERILVTAAAPAVSAALRAQLGDGGILVAPVGDDRLQTVRRYRKRGARFDSEDIEGVRFVPLIEDPQT
ncbi:MAG: protein-L-isoaspartate(D-aspartate) O-methyltransferase [Gemmatimonadetes bacterium]|nr:protein-L-isoaspartate(D-aspartate) O-methyltransferase [Gemmatimonadota bacterium]